MEVASTSRELHFFPKKDQRFEIRSVGCNLIDFSHVSSLPINPKFDISSRTCRNRKDEERYDVIAAPKKRKLSKEGEEDPLNKRQKKNIEQDVTTKPKSVTALGVNLRETDSRSKITKLVDAKAITAKFAKPEKSITALRLGETKTKSVLPEKSVTLSRVRLHQTKTKPNVITKPIEETENQNCSFRDLIAKAKNKVQEKRHIDRRRENIPNQRIEARLALNQIVATVAFDDHLKYHRELEELGCGFIHDQVSCLNINSLLSRNNYLDESVLEKIKLSLSDGDSPRKKQKRLTKDKSMESSLQDPEISKDDVEFRSAECTNQRENSNFQSSTIERIQ